MVDPPHKAAWLEGGGFIWPHSEEKQAAARSAAPVTFNRWKVN